MRPLADRKVALAQYRQTGEVGATRHSIGVDAGQMTREVLGIVKRVPKAAPATHGTATLRGPPGCGPPGDRMAALQRRARVTEAALGGLERATESTMLRATRYLEKGMTGAVARITDGRYRRVRIDDESLDISVVAPEKGDWVDVRELSDGTLGQIYLAARLGLIPTTTGDRRPPLVLDDPFVTFDDAHAARGFELLL